MSRLTTGVGPAIGMDCKFVKLQAELSEDGYDVEMRARPALGMATPRGTESAEEGYSADLQADAVRLNS